MEGYGEADNWYELFGLLRDTVKGMFLYTAYWIEWWYKLFMDGSLSFLE